MTYIPVLLIVDDNAIDQQLYRRMIERAGFVGELKSFLGAAEALNHLGTNPLGERDLILLDINMPGMSGLEFLEQFVRDFTYDFSPIVVMSTTSLSPDDDRCARSFSVVRDFLRKPLTPDRLRHVVAQS